MFLFCCFLFTHTQHTHTHTHIHNTHTHNTHTHTTHTNITHTHTRNTHTHTQHTHTHTQHNTQKQALTWSGAPSYSQTTLTSSLGEFSVSFWVSSKSYNTSVTPPIFQVLQGSTVLASLVLRSVSTTWCTVFTLSGATLQWCAPTTNPWVKVVDGNWHHVAVTWQPGVAAWLYIDGMGVTSTAFPAAPLGTPPLALRVGQSGTLLQATQFKGRINELNMYSRALTRAEIQQIVCSADLLFLASAPLYVAWSDVILNTVSTISTTSVLKDSTFGGAPDIGCGNFDLVMTTPATDTTSFFMAPLIAGTWTQLTVAGWVQTVDLTATSTMLISIAWGTTDNGLGWDIKGNPINVGQLPCTIYPVIDLFPVNTWVHFAVLVDAVNFRTTVYVNNMVTAQCSFTAAAVVGGGFLVLGQEQDSLGGGFASNQNFNGRMTRYNIYSRLLRPDEIRANAAGTLEGDILNFNSLRLAGSGPYASVLGSTVATTASTQIYTLTFAATGTESFSNPLVSLPAMTKITMGWWMKLSGLASSGSSVISYGLLTNDNEIAVYLNPTNTIQFTALGAAVTFTNPFNISDGLWHHYAYTIAADTKACTYYLDFVQVGSVVTTATTRASATGTKGRERKKK